jgi:hypothetical protein
LVGLATYDLVSGVGDLLDGNYLIVSQRWNNGAIMHAGAATLASSHFRLKGTIQPWNSVTGMAAEGGGRMYVIYDTPRQRLVVGRPAENIVSFFTMDQVFAGDFDP